MVIKVLIVDDTRTVRFQLKEMVAGMGYEVDEAADGVEALERVRESRPHIILMDVMMPNMDGIESCRRLKGDPATREIKVIMVTTKDNYQKVTEAFKARCDDCIMKPVKAAELKAKLETMSKMVRAISILRSL
jgi:CheY-like chemotaxis protein